LDVDARSVKVILGKIFTDLLKRDSWDSRGPVAEDGDIYFHIASSAYSVPQHRGALTPSASAQD
jgi:hypothetical protein